MQHKFYEEKMVLSYLQCFIEVTDEKKRVVPNFTDPAVVCGKALLLVSIIFTFNLLLTQLSASWIFFCMASE